jgi:hypothetical protein
MDSATTYSVARENASKTGAGFQQPESKMARTE